MTAIRYVRYTPGLQTVLERNVLFALFISAIPAMMPVVGLGARAMPRWARGRMNATVIMVSQGSMALGGGEMGLSGRQSRNHLCAAWTGDAVPDQSGSSRPTIDRLYGDAQCRSWPSHELFPQAHLHSTTASSKSLEIPNCEFQRIRRALED